MSDVVVQLDVEYPTAIELDVETSAVEGPQGERGPTGIAGNPYQWHQVTMSETWGPIPHMLGKYPQAVVMDDERTQRYNVLVQDIDQNNCYIHISPQMVGYADLY